MPPVCGILDPQPGIKPMPPALEAWRPNHRTAREVPYKVLLLIYLGHIGILVPQSGIKPTPLALEVQSLNHQTFS